MAIGGAAGVVGALVLVRFMRSLLFEISAYDPVVLFGAAAVLFFAVLMAGAVPSLRATNVDPIVALRYE